MNSEEFSIIPAPLHIRRLTGEFVLYSNTRILVEPENEALAAIAKELTDKLSAATGFKLMWDTSSVESAPRGSIFLTTRVDAGQSSNAERYELEVLPHSITVSAANAVGIHRGLQTLRQLFPPEIESAKPVSDPPDWKAPAVRIVDEPRFQWRGLLLDCCRRFMSKDFILRVIDLLAYHKMNRFHWHLTDDQGWRIEIKSYPKLTEIGAYRTGGNGARYGGYYTQDDIREVVAYAAARGITVVPEIEMPGHSVAAIASYPKLSCTGRTISVASEWGIFDDVLCAGSDDTYEFIGEVLAEVTELFPGKYVHIGGEECPRTRWDACPRCRRRIENEGLKDSDALLEYFVNRVARILGKRDRRLIGWDEVLTTGLVSSAAVQAWHGIGRVAPAARMGHDVIVSPYSHSYLDHDSRDVDLGKVYDFDPVPADLPAGALPRVLGGECTLWTQHVPRSDVDATLFPRLVAFAERMWSSTGQSTFEDFHRRLLTHYQRLERLGVEYGSDTAS